MRISWLLILGLLLSGCESLGYYLQSAGGHLQLMSAAHDIDGLIASPDTDPQLAARLRQVRGMRRFAVSELALPDNASYTRYADVGRDALVWSLVAAPELALDAHQWCYPVIGCASYRGYFDPADAHAHAEQMRRQGWDTAVEAVPAYSTLGWFDDPLPNTVIDWPQAALAGLIFHELAHQRLYARDDSAFNESYATVVARAGVERWLHRPGVDANQAGQALRAWRARRERQHEFAGLLLASRAALQSIYLGAGDDRTKRRAKAVEFKRLRSEYRAMRERWGGHAGYDGWFDRDLNNAHLVSQQTYSRWVPALQGLLQRLDHDLAAFLRQCAEQARAPAARRLAWLRQLEQEAH